MGFINKYSSKSFLGRLSKNIIENDNFISWEVRGKRKVIIIKYDSNIIDELYKLMPFTFLYFDKDIVDILKNDNRFNVRASKGEAIETDISKWKGVSGKEWKDIRYTLNKAKEYNIEARDTFDILEVEEFVKKWRYSYGTKYFRDHSSQNTFFFRSGNHNECISRFYYIDGKLVSYAVLSYPDLEGNAPYIIRKTLYQEYYGLTEYVDCDILNVGKEAGIKIINWGGGSNKLLKYKAKYPHSKTVYHYEGNCEVKNG